MHEVSQVEYVCLLYARDIIAFRKQFPYVSSW